MDFRWVNALTLDPAFTIPLCREMLEKLVGMSRKAGGCLTFLLHSTECSTETKGKEKEKGERANKVCFKTFFICSQRREREKREREEKTPMFE